MRSRRLLAPPRLTRLLARLRLPVALLATLLPVLLLMNAAALAAKTTHRHHRHKRPALDSCAVHHKQVLASDEQAQVYLLRDGQGVREVFGCAAAARRSFTLGPFPQCASPNECVGVEAFALSGTVVAFGSVTISAPAFPSEMAQRRFLVQVRDLRTNRMLRIAPTGVPAAPQPGLTGIGRARAIVVKSDGASAWIAADETSPLGGGYEVYAADAGGLRLLAAGPGIDPGSLALAGSTLSWSQSGQAATGVLN